MPLNIVLVEPEIPQNAGNIVRTAAVTKSIVHMVRPLGFEVSDKYLKRAGLDYWHYLDITYYNNTAEFFEKNQGEFFYFTTKGRHTHSDIKYPDNAYLIFGKETKGLPEELICWNISYPTMGSYVILRVMIRQFLIASIIPSISQQ
jgi:tRNA (cytidine/uridine-2'-O-)-methyltransferase